MDTYAALARLTQAFERASARVSRAEQLGPSIPIGALLTLWLIASGQSATQREIAEALGLSKQAAFTWFEKLRDLGLIVDVDDAVQRRASPAAATDRGREVAAALAKELDHTFGPGGLDALHQMLATVRLNVPL